RFAETANRSAGQARSVMTPTVPQTHSTARDRWATTSRAGGERPPGWATAIARTGPAGVGDVPSLRELEGDEPGVRGVPVAGRRTVMAGVRPTPCRRLVGNHRHGGRGESPGCPNQTPGPVPRTTGSGRRRR